MEEIFIGEEVYWKHNNTYIGTVDNVHSSGQISLNNTKEIFGEDLVEVTPWFSGLMYTKRQIIKAML